jgi:hypothetical protein
MAAECEIVEEPLSVLKEYGQIPIKFVVGRVFDIRVNDHGLGGFSLVEPILEKPYTKDYDAEREEGPAQWAIKWNISNWGLFSAVVVSQRVGGCVLA